MGSIFSIKLGMHSLLSFMPLFGAPLTHLVFETLAFICGYQYYVYLKKDYDDPISPTNRVWILIGAAAGAFFLSRIVGMLENPIILRQSLVVAISNRTIVGGLLGGLLGVELVKRIIGEKNSSGDLFTYPIILALMIGRLGCFFAGLNDNTYGIETSLPWGIDLGDGIKRHPTNLYEILFLGLLWFALMQIEKGISLKRGSVFKLFMISYLVFRLLTDFIKPYVMVIGTFNSIQVACILGLLYYFRSITQPRTLLKANA